MPDKFVMFFEKITKWVDDGSPVDVIYFDVPKAFDKVPHQRVILKLQSHGMGNSIINEGLSNMVITQVMVTRGAACKVISELPVCHDYTVYTSQAAEQDNKTHLTWPKQSVPIAFSVYRCHNTELGTCISQIQG